MSETKKQKTTSGLRTVLSNLLVFGISAVISLALAEVALRQVAPHDTYMSLVPSERQELTNGFYPFYPGTDSTVFLSVNEFGYRSASSFQEDHHGILTIGGSTTYCIGISDEESWPWLLEERLNESQNKAITVGNVGVPGYNSHHNLLQLKYLEPQFENIQTVVMLMGINDYLLVLKLGEEYLPTRENSYALNRTFKRLPRSEGKNWIQRTELWMHIRDVKNNLKTKYKRVDRDLLRSNRIKKYLKVEKQNKLPDLSLGLDAYERNLREAASIARKRNLQLVWVTQPVSWYEGMTDEEELLVAVSTPIYKDKSYTHKAMAEGMHKFNERLIEVGLDEGVTVIDLATALPKGPAFIFDDCHYSKQGAAMVADIIHNQIKNLLD